MSPVPDIWLLRSDGERGESIEGTASKPILVWKFPKKNLRLWEETANPWLSCSAWLSLALSISPGGWAGEALASPGRREGWRMSWAGCHCEGRRTERRLTGSNTATSGPPVCSRAGPAYSGALLSSNSPLTLCCPSQSQAGPDSCRLPDWPDCVSRCGVVVVAGEAGTRARAHLTSPLTRSVKCPATDPLGVILTWELGS